MDLEELERTLNVISQLPRSNIFYFDIQEIIGWGKSRTVLEGKYLRDIREIKNFRKYKSYHTEEIQFLSGKCYIFITDDYFGSCD